MGKILLYASILFSLVTAVLGYLNRETLVTTKDTLAQTQSELSSTKSTLADTTAKLQKTQQELTAAITEKESLSSQLITATQRATTAESQVTNLNSQITEKNTQIANLETDNKAKNDEIEKLRNQSTTDSSASQLADMKKQLEEKDTVIASLQTQLESSKAQIQKYADDAAARAKKQMAKSLEGRVLAVNNAWNFVVLSLGERNGIVNNAEMLVKRGNQLVGKVRITSVEPSSSIADIVSNASGNATIQPGDNVIYQAE